MKIPGINHFGKCALGGCTQIWNLIRLSFILSIVGYVLYPMFIFCSSHSFLVKISVIIYFIMLYFFADTVSIFQNARNKLGLTNEVLENKSMCLIGIYGPALILIISAYFS